MTRTGRTAERVLPALALAVVLAGAATVGVLPDPPPPPRPAAAVEVPVRGTVLGCTAFRGRDARFRSTTAAVPGSSGPSVVRPVRPAGAGDTVVVDGPGAVGLAAWRVETSEAGAAMTACPAPRTSWWFAGAGGGLDHRSEIVLTNVDEGPAVVDVDLVGTSGPVDEAALRGVTVPGGGSRVIPVVDVAPRSDEVAVHVTTSQGRVVAQVRDTVRSVQARSSVGIEWLPPAAPPATDVRVVGLVGGADRRTLLVTNPSDRQALVAIQVVTRDGAFVPTGAEEVSVDPGSVAAVDLTRAVGSAVAAVRLRSDTEILGAVRSQAGSDIQYAGTADVATGYLAAPAGGRRTTLVLQAADQPTGATATAWSTRGRRLATQGLSVPPSGLATWALPPDAAYVLLEPDTGRGDLVAAVVASGPGVAGMPLTEVPTTVLQPEVRMRTEEAPQG